MSTLSSYLNSQFYINSTWVMAQARAKPKLAVTGGFDLAYIFCKPKLSEARPKL